ncbi:hypothetical protein AN639_08155 [Candidatus Epulonipiscium fishelsonii]|uniref:Uncharacterized protein n=1 Tax=Candidatus Epulonipiscium fishelsonii TaxID=77094 RepID=A0ACC8XBV5_9FIRM|nr:hypothetical protein AN639_08155 [Epulopiscium sp. SCG-B05WGA-EpuloA1]ONI40092.1 hypothetical protein AN396_06485 [Epulopiscium sp. SCG-B11WGA-EpuloA1]
MLAMIGTTLPVILIFALGIWCRKTNFLSAETMKDMKKFVINIAVPCVLFETFVNMKIEIEQLTLLVLMLILLGLFMVVGKLCDAIPILKYKYNPYICSGFSFGLLGVGLFSMIYGPENLGTFSIMGLAQELFVWLFYYLMFRIDTQNKKFDLKILLNIIKSPIIIAIALGIIFNVFGIISMFSTNSIMIGTLKAVSYIADISTPFMLISLGYGLTFETKYIKSSIKLMGIRAGVVFLTGAIFKFLIIDNIIETNALFNISYITFLLLPPMFSLPLLVSEEGTEEDANIVNCAVGIYTIISILAIMALSIVAPSLS